MVVLFTIDAGGGHRAAARALVAAAEERGGAVRFRVENFQQLLLPLDLLKRLTGVSLESAYNLILKHHASALMVPLLRLMQLAIRTRRGAIVGALADWLRREPRPEAVLSVIPNFNGLLQQALREALPGVPLLVVLTDLADFPPRFWIEPGLDRVVVGTPEAREQALAAGVPRERVSLVSGMVLHPRFHRIDRAEARPRVRGELGLGEADFAVTLLFGGKGSPEMAPLADELLAQDAELRVIAIGGDNPGLVERLRGIEKGSGGRLRVFGFTDRVAELLAASDLLVTKPGPASLSEAFQLGVPVVVVRNVHTIPQERFNTELVARHGLGLVVRSPRAIPAAVSGLRRDPVRLEAMREAVRRVPPNRAVYEVLDVVAAAINHHPAD